MAQDYFKAPPGPMPRDGIKLALLDFATQYSMLACGMCLEWAPRLFRYGVPPSPCGSAVGAAAFVSSRFVLFRVVVLRGLPVVALVCLVSCADVVWFRPVGHLSFIGSFEGHVMKSM